MVPTPPRTVLIRLGSTVASVALFSTWTSYSSIFLTIAVPLLPIEPLLELVSLLIVAKKPIPIYSLTTISEFCTTYTPLMTGRFAAAVAVIAVESVMVLPSHSASPLTVLAPYIVPVNIRGVHGSD